jgi:outer membrane protein assembly factor BamB
LLAVAVLLGGCSLFGREKSTAEPPAELVDFEPALEIRRLWSAKVGGGSEGLRLGLAPATDGARVYAGANDGSVRAFNATNGRTEWSVDTRLPLSAGPGLGGGLLAFGTTDGQLVALDAATGEERWRVTVGSEVLAPPAIASNVVALRSVDGRLRGFSTSDGRELWSAEQASPVLILRGHSAPHIAGQLVVAGFDNGRVGAYQLATGDQVWELPIANPTGRNELDRLVDTGDLEIVGNDVFAVGYQGRAVSVDVNTGLVLWQQEMSSYTGLDVDLNLVYITNDVGSVVALNRRDGTQAWVQDGLRLRDVTAPTRFGSAVVVGDFEGYVHWIDIDDGSFLARERAGSARIAAPPIVVGRNVVVQSEDGSVSALTVVVEETS